MSTYELPREPGRLYEYSNLGFGLLGQALSARAGLSYPELIRRRIVLPLGLRSTRIDESLDMRRRNAVGYTTQGIPIVDSERGALDAAGALRSTANDLAELLEVVLGYRSSPLAPAMAAMLQMRRVGGMAPWSTQIALAWNVTIVGDREIAWKNGSAGGYRSFIGYDKSEGVGIVAIINVQSDLGVDDIGMHLLGADVSVDFHIPKDHKQVAIDPKLLDRYVGRYFFSENDVMTITRDGDRLFFIEEGQPKLELFAEGNSDFFFKETDAQITFETTNDAGPATAAIWHQSSQDQRGKRLK